MSDARESARFVATAAGRLHVVERGEGRPLLLLHGGPGFYDYLGPLARLLEGRGIRTIRFDQRGCGRSDGAPPLDVAANVDDIERVREALGIGTWIVAGHSWGANLALACAVRHPDRVEGLACLSGTGLGVDWKAEFAANAAARLGPDAHARFLALKARLKATRPTVVNDDLRAYHRLLLAPDLVGGLAAATDPIEFPINFEVSAVTWADWERLAATEAFRAKVDALAVPTLVLHGMEDPRPWRISRELADRIPGACFVAVEGAGHYPWKEKPDETLTALAGFAAGIGAARAWAPETLCRRLSEEDWRLFSTLRLEALRNDPLAFGSTLEREAAYDEGRWRSILAEERTALFALLAGDEPVGLTGVGIHRDDPSGSTAWLWGSWIRPAFRGRGLSAALYRARLGWAASRPGVRRVTMGLWADNPASRRACLRHGFRLVRDEVMTRAADGRTLVHSHYELELSPSPRAEA